MGHKPFYDRTGQRFGRLVVIQYLKDVYVAPSGRRVSKWRCLCDCGGVTDVTPSNLTSGDVSSCGCLRSQITRGPKYKHGMSAGGNNPIPEYEIWKGMIARCTNPKHNAFHNYGGRGIAVCKEWRKDFAAFIAHIGRRPTSRHTIDRIDNDGNYELGNVRWVTRAEQRRNMRPITHCRRGHPLDEANTYTSKGGKRACRICMRAKENARNAAQRAKMAA